MPIVSSSAYADGRKIGTIALEDIRQVLQTDGALIWVGLYEPSEEELRRVQKEFDLHDLAVEDALRAHQRPKIEDYGESLFVVLRTAHLHEGTIERGETLIFVGHNYVVTVRHGGALPYADVLTRCETKPQLLRRGPGFVLYALMDFVVDHYFPIVETLEDKLETLEEEIFGGTFDRATTGQIYGLKRDLVGIKRAVSPLIDVCNRLVRYDAELIQEDMRLYFRDIYDHVIRINETVDNVRDLLTTALEANLSLIAVRQNEVMKKLAAWAAILAIPTLIAGIYGMNFEMPELHWPFAYPGILAVMGVLCGLLYWWFDRAGWL